MLAVLVGFHVMTKIKYPTQVPAPSIFFFAFKHRYDWCGTFELMNGIMIKVVWGDFLNKNGSLCPQHLLYTLLCLESLLKLLIVVEYFENIIESWKISCNVAPSLNLLLEELKNILFAKNHESSNLLLQEILFQNSYIKSHFLYQNIIFTLLFMMVRWYILRHLEKILPMQLTSVENHTVSTKIHSRLLKLYENREKNILAQSMLKKYFGSPKIDKVVKKVYL